MESGSQKELLLKQLRNRGNHEHNMEVLAKKFGTLIVAYRPNEECSPDDFLPCEFCLGWYANDFMYRHVPRCPFGPDTDRKFTRVQYRYRLLIAGTPGKSDVFSTVLSGLKPDMVSPVVKGDPLIIQHGKELTQMKIHERESFNYVRSRLRLLAKILTKLRELHGHPNGGLIEFICPRQFDSVVEVVKAMAGFSAVGNSYAKPSLTARAGQALSQVALTLYAYALTREDSALASRADTFKRLLDIRWNICLGATARRTLQQRRVNMVKLIPLTADVQKLARSVKNAAEEAYRKLKENPTQDSWTKLRNAALVQCMTFNRRRPGETSKMRVQDFEGAHQTDQQDLMESLSPLEQALAQQLHRVEMIGKRGRVVPMLLTGTMFRWMTLLRETRDFVGIPQENPYFFAHFSSDAHASGGKHFKEFSERSGAEKPELLLATNLRKQIATLSQILNLQDHELDVLAGFMGHDIRVHRQYYRLPSDTFQAAKVSKLLISLESGGLPSCAGRSLEELEIPPDEDVGVTEEEALRSANSEDVSGLEADDVVQPALRTSGEPTVSAAAQLMEQEQELPSVHVESEDASVDAFNRNAGNQGRQPWSSEERAAIYRHFGPAIAVGTLPAKRQSVKLENAA